MKKNIISGENEALENYEKELTIGQYEYNLSIKQVVEHLERSS